VSSDERVKKLEETMSKLLDIKPEEREKLLRIIREHKPQKIVKALNDVVFYDKRGRAKVIMTLDEFEKMLKKVRY
jgi:hypothetical protein